MMRYRQNQLFSTRSVVTNLIIINGLFFLAQNLLPFGRTITDTLGLHFWESDMFRPYQLITSMFLHADLMHLFFNMFSLWMFGRILEYDLGPKRFLTYYMVCGIGASLLHLGVSWIEIAQLKSAVAESPMHLPLLQQRIDVVTIGASGAVYGLLLAFGVIHPNNIIMLMIPPIPIKAKYFVIIFGVIARLSGISGRGGNIAHFAHVGGMLWGWALLYYWKRSGKIYY